MSIAILAVPIGVALLCGGADQPVTVGHLRQLFVDDFIVAEVSGVKFTLHQPTKHPDNPVIREDRPWESKSVALYGTVIYDEEDRLFKMWYRSIDDTCYACYATSEDGVHWQKPVLNAVPHKGSKANNIVLGSRQFYLDGFAVIRDANEWDPKRRYKMLTYNNRRRFAAMVSPDGIHWTGPVNNQDAGPDTGDVISMYYDPGLGKYVGLLKRRFQYPNGGKVRARLLSFSDDFVNWTEPEFNLVPDEKDKPSTEFYSQVAYVYQGLRIGYVTPFVKSTEMIGTQLVYSRDGRKWERYRERKPFIPNTEGTFDAGMLIAGGSGLVVRDGKVWIYYCGYNTDHAGKARGKSEISNGIGLAQLRLDGFVSADAGAEEGTLTTKPMTCSGRVVRINAEAPDGEIRAELLDAERKPIEGCDLASSVPFQGDSLNAVLKWKAPKAQLAPGRTVSIRFHLKNARLYSFWFDHE